MAGDEQGRQAAQGGRGARGFVQLHRGLGWGHKRPHAYTPARAASSNSQRAEAPSSAMKHGAAWERTETLQPLLTARF